MLFQADRILLQSFIGFLFLETCFINPPIQAKAMPTDLFEISPSLSWALWEAAVEQGPEDS